jgi:beta-lactam-binding protein with PASTA domain
MVEFDIRFLAVAIVLAAIWFFIWYRRNKKAAVPHPSPPQAAAASCSFQKDPEPVAATS